MIKNIILDLGGVIIDLDYNKCSQAFLALGSDQFEKYYSKQNQYSLFDELEIGKIDEVTFRKKLKLLLKLNVSDEQLDAAWNAMLIDLPKERLSYLKTLSSYYKLFLFSNTNAIHMRAVNEILRKNFNKTQNLDDFFIKAYYSHLFGHRKPHPESFLKILKLNNLKKAETLFVDDSQQHILGAQEAGLHTILLKHPHDLTSLQNLVPQLERETYA